MNRVVPCEQGGSERRDPRGPRLCGTCHYGLGAYPDAKVKKIKLHVMWLDLANTFGLVPCQLLWLAMERIHILHEITTMLKWYFSGFLLRFLTPMFTTEWINLQGIVIVYTISPILFVIAMQSLWTTSGVKQGLRGEQDAMAEGFMGRMSFKSKKSRSLLIVKCKVVTFHWYHWLDRLFPWCYRSQ